MFIRGTSGVSGHPKLHTYQQGYMLPVLGADELLFSSRHKGVLRLFRDLAGLSDEDYSRLYGRLINQFLEFVQILPQKPNGVLGSLLNHAFARAALVFQRYCQQKEKRVTPLLKYAVFSAALLKDLGKVVSQQHITLVDADGNFINDWNPMSGSMLGQSEFYKLYQISQRYLRIESEITPLLAQKVIPKDGFLWLSTDLNVFSDWLAALLGEEGVGGKEITWALALIKQEDFINMLTTLDGASVDMTFAEDFNYAEMFIEWLREKIESGELSVNKDDSAIHVVNEGVLLERKLFKQFADLSNVPVNFQIVFTQFGNLMGIPKKCGADFLNAQYFSQDEAIGSNRQTAFTGALSQQRTHHPIREGMLLSNADIIFSSQVPAVSHMIKAIHAKIPGFHQPPVEGDNPANRLSSQKGK